MDWSWNPSFAETCRMSKC